MSRAKQKVTPLFNARLRQLVIDRRISLGDLAAAVGLNSRQAVHPYTVSRLPDVELNRKFAKALGVSPEWLAGYRRD